MRDGPAIGLIESTSIARGMVVCDAMVKQAPVDVLEAYTVTPGKYVVLVCGEVAEVEEAMQAGLAKAAETLLDELFLPNPHASIVPALRGEALSPDPDAIGIFETSTIASTLLAVDAALKAAETSLLELRLATGIGGKAYFALTGELHELQAAFEAGCASIEPQRVLNTELVARPHEDFVEAAFRRGPLRAGHPSRHG